MSQYLSTLGYPLKSLLLLSIQLLLQVTKSGEPVYNMDSPHKKPYESIIIGCQCKNDSDCQHKTIPREKVVISVPCILHSKKPPLCGKFPNFYQFLYARRIMLYPLASVCPSVRPSVCKLFRFPVTPPTVYVRLS